MKPFFSSLYKELKTLILHPTVFYTTIAPRKTFGQVFLFDILQTYIGLFSLLTVYSTIFSFSLVPLIQKFFPSIPQVAFILIPLVIILIFPIFFIILSFVMAFVSFIILKIVGGRGSYFSTYRTQVYSSFPSAVGLFIFLFGGDVLCLYSIVLQVIGFAKAHRVSYFKGAIPFITITLGILITFFFAFGFIFFSASTGFLNHKASPSEHLTVSGSSLGESILDECVPKNDTIFAPNDTLCIIIGNVSGFQQGKDELHWVDMTIQLRNSSGNLIGYDGSILDEDESHTLLTSGIFEGQYLSRLLTDLDPGRYSHEITIIDKVSRKNALVNMTFFVNSSKNPTSGISDSMPEKAERTYTIDKKDYDVRLLSLNTTQQTVRFQVNKVVLSDIASGESITLSDSSLLHIIFISELDNETTVSFLLYHPNVLH